MFNNFSKKFFQSTAFSLVEVSVVILIIGIFVSGVVGTKYLYNKAVIASAQSLTQASPIRSTKELSLWLETSSEQSLSDLERSDGASLSSWNDISGHRIDVNVGSSNPTYANTINRIPAVRFSGDSNGYFNVDGKLLNNSNYTIIVVEQRESNSGDNYFIGDSTITASGQNLLLGYKTDGSVIHSQAGTTVADNSNAYSSYVSSYSSDVPRVFVFTSSESGKKTYINGNIAATSSDNSKVTNLSNLYIGKGYTGQIGELAIFTKELDYAEIVDISYYLKKKWNIKQTISSNGTAPACVGGIIDNNGNCTGGCTVNIDGVTETSINPGSGSFTCNSSLHFIGSVPYTCTNNNLSTSTSCNCADGYYKSGSSCIPITCTASAGTGYSSKSNLAYATSGSGLFSCDVAGYSGNINYTCASVGSATITGGSCTLATCSISGVTGIASTNINYGTTSLNCGVGYTGTVNFTCNSDTTWSITSGSCAVASASYKWLLVETNAGNAWGTTTQPFICNASTLGKYVWRYAGQTTIPSGDSFSGSGLYGIANGYCANNQAYGSGSACASSSNANHVWKCVYQ